MRGMGDQKPAGLTIARELWLDEDGRGAHLPRSASPARCSKSGGSTPRRDRTSAPCAAAGRASSSRAIRRTTRPAWKSARAISTSKPPAAWRARTHSPPPAGAPMPTRCSVTLNLPPGWRLFALFGADWVRGDWLTAWTLLDLFLLLIFTLAVFRLWGIRRGGARVRRLRPRVSRTRRAALPLAHPARPARAPARGAGRLGPARCSAWESGSRVALFVLALVPFVARQVQQALYPQLEIVRLEPRSWAFAASLPDQAPAADFATRRRPTDAPAEQRVRRSAERADAYSTTVVFSVSGRKQRRVERQPPLRRQGPHPDRPRRAGVEMARGELRLERPGLRGAAGAAGAHLADASSACSPCCASLLLLALAAVLLGARQARRRRSSARRARRRRCSRSSLTHRERLGADADPRCRPRSTSCASACSNRPTLTRTPPTSRPSRSR